MRTCNHGTDYKIKPYENAWYKRAQVLDIKKPLIKTEFDEDKWDYLPELMPFYDHPLWIPINEETKKRVASYAWIMYNMRTILIETNIVSPLCHSIVNKKINIIENFEFQHLATQALIDESYHTLLSLDGIKLIMTKRKIDPIDFPAFDLDLFYKERMSTYSDNSNKLELFQLATVIASEVLISDYLSLLATSQTIQPICQQVTKIHWHDEVAHSNVFKLIADKLITQINSEQIEFFIENIYQSSKWFIHEELDVWRTILMKTEVSPSE